MFASGGVFARDFVAMPAPPFQPSPELESFRQRILTEPALLGELRRTHDTAEFISASIQAADKMGITLTRAEMEEALRAARGEWIERWIQ